MKILYLVPHLSTGGLPQYTYLIMKRMMELNHDVYCVEFSDIAPIYNVQKERIKKILPESNFLTLYEDKN